MGTRTIRARVGLGRAGRRLGCLPCRPQHPDSSRPHRPPAISSDDARQLFDERREAEARAREIARRQEQAAVEADQQWRAQLPNGLPWHALPHGVSPAEAWAQAEKDARPKRRSVLEEALAGEAMTFHPIGPDGNES